MSANRFQEMARAQRDEFIARVVAMKHEAGTLGLYATMHAFDAVTCAYGQEVAGHPARVVSVDTEQRRRRTP